MDELDHDQSVEYLKAIFVSVFISLAVGIGIGYTYKSIKDKPANNLLAAMQDSFDTMRNLDVPDNELFLKVMHEERGWHRRFDVADDEAGFSFIELHYLPRKALPKLVDEKEDEELTTKKPILDIHEDVGDPEHDGKAPTEEADKWAKDKEN